MTNIEILETFLDEKTEAEMIALSKLWEDEDISYGYHANERSDIEGNRIFAAFDSGKMIGYIFGKSRITDNLSSIIPKNEEFFEVEELYVHPQYRSKGVGRKLFTFAEEAVKGSYRYISLGTSTKNYRAILHFYIDEVGMDFHSARLFKKIEG